MLISVSTGVGLQVKIREKIAGFKGHAQISNYHNNTSEITDNPISINRILPVLMRFPAFLISNPLLPNSELRAQRKAFKEYFTKGWILPIIGVFSKNI